MMEAQRIARKKSPAESEKKEAYTMRREMEEDKM